MSFPSCLNQNRAPVIFWSIVGLGIVGYFGWRWWNPLTVEGPIASITLDHNDAVVTLSPEAKVEDVVKMSVFLGVSPLEALDKSGKPLQENDLPRGFFRREHSVKNARVVFQGSVHQISVFPSDVYCEKFFCEQISKEIRGQSLSRVIIMVPTPDGTRTEIEALLSGDGVRVNEVIWHQ